MTPRRRLLLTIALILLIGPIPIGSQTGQAGPPVACDGPRALVLGGGAVTGYAWEIGLLKGL